MSNNFNKNVRVRTFHVGDLVLRKVFPNTVDVNIGNFGATWEGPYLIEFITRRGAYRLATIDGNLVPRS